MKPEIDLQHELVQLLVEEAVRLGLQSPLREPILRAVEEPTEERVEPVGQEQPESDASENGEKRRTTKAVRGLTVLVVLFVLLYIAIKRSPTDDEMRENT